MSTTNTLPTLRDLSDRELALCQEVEAITGTFDAQQQLQDSATGAAYRQVHRAYLALAASADAGAVRMEAGKRLLFLNWYAAVEPDVFTGLTSLDPEVMASGYALLDSELAGYLADGEFHWMLSFYACWRDFIADFRNPTLPALAAFTASVDTTILHVPVRRLGKHSLDNRGQMGLYWQSMGTEIS